MVSAVSPQFDFSRLRKKDQQCRPDIWLSRCGELRQYYCCQPDSDAAIPASRLAPADRRHAVGGAPSERRVLVRWRTGFRIRGYTLAIDRAYSRLSASEASHSPSLVTQSRTRHAIYDKVRAYRPEQNRVGGQVFATLSHARRLSEGFKRVEQLFIQWSALDCRATDPRFVQSKSASTLRMYCSRSGFRRSQDLRQPGTGLSGSSSRPNLGCEASAKLSVELAVGGAESVLKAEELRGQLHWPNCSARSDFGADEFLDPA